MASGKPTTAGGWLELRVEADAESVDAVAEFLGRFGYNQGVVVEEPYVQDPDGDNLAVDPSRPVRVSTFIPRDERLSETLEQVQRGLWYLRQLGEVGELETEERPEEDWANAWKEHFQVTRIGRNFVIRPSWRPYEPTPGDVVIDLDPGMAFGTGLHPTTEMCLAWLEDVPVAGARVLDAGAGSGILSIAAVKLGAAQVDALEIDPVAVDALRHNVALNGLEGQITVAQADITAWDPSGRTYDLILANIISRILARAAPVLAAATAPGGQLILSGVIEEHEADVVAAFSEAGVVLRERRTIGDWVSLVMERPV